MQSAMREVRRRGARVRCRVLPLAAAIALVYSGAAGAATIAVNDAGGDSTAGKCTLADAVQAINTATAVNACVAGDGVSDTIDLSFFTSATTIAFQNPNAVAAQAGIAFTKPATVTGPVASGGTPLVTIARSSNSGIDFRVIRTSADLTLSNLTISGGQVSGRGAGIYASGHANLTINNSVISGNNVSGTSQYSGGGIASEYGNITLTGSTVSGNSCTGNGGGIYTLHEGKITLTNSTVRVNDAGYSGGGIYSFNGDVTLVGSTVSSNATTVSGGVSGGGINAYVSVHLTNSTVTDNYSAGGGAGIFLAGAFYGGKPPGGARPSRVTPPTLPQTSPYKTGNAYLYFSTIAGNRGSGNVPTTSGLKVPNYLHAVGSIITGNAYGNLDLSFPGVQFTGSNNIIGSPPPQAPPDTRDCDAKLGTLGAWGGPTETLPLLTGSCAINTGPEVFPSGITTDQRGLPRVVGGTADVGAFEKQGLNDPADIIFQNGFEGS